MPTPRSVLFVVNDAEFFLSHRLPIALAARAAGLRVEVATPDCPEASGIREHGFEFHPIALSRRRSTPLTELGTVWSLTRLFARRRPDVVHLVTIKPNLYGSVAARLAGVPRVVNAVSGLGYIFMAQGWWARARRCLVLAGYRVAFLHPRKRVIFQNLDDRDEFVGRGLLSADDVVLIRGSGVDLERFSLAAEPAGAPVVVLASRLLYDKGVGEFAQAARKLRARGSDARFVLVGATDPGNPTSISDAQVRDWVNSGVVEWWGKSSNMPDVFARSHLVCLPSYREGLPKVLIEAAACGRAIVTTDVPGCRDVVRDGTNGLLVPPRNAAALAEAIGRLVESPELRRRMGLAGRALVEQEFSVGIVVSATLAVYGVLGPAARC